MAAKCLNMEKPVVHCPTCLRENAVFRDVDKCMPVRTYTDAHEDIVPQQLTANPEYMIDWDAICNPNITEDYHWLPKSNAINNADLSKRNYVSL